MNLNDLFKKSLEAYIEMLTIHINTKTTDTVLHEETEAHYQILFDVMHKIGERYVDLGNQVKVDKDVNASRERVEEILDEMKKLLNESAVNPENTAGTNYLISKLASHVEGA